MHHLERYISEKDISKQEIRILNKIIITVLITFIDTIVIFFPFLRFHPWLLQSQWAHSTIYLTTLYCIFHVSNPHSVAMSFLMHSIKEAEMPQLMAVPWLLSWDFWSAQACHFPQILFFFTSLQKVFLFCFNLNFSPARHSCRRYHL